jgi:hypothetical protein
VKRITVVVAALCVLLGSANRPGSADSLDFVVIQPGQPGTAEEAQPTMDALGSYVQKRMGGGASVRGRYFNELTSALEYLREASPKWGIVSMPFYATHGRQLGLKPLASSRPGGYDKDVWRLMVPKDGPGDWRQVKGAVSGTMLHEPAAAACLLFGANPAGLSFTLNGTLQPLMALRQVTKGKAAGVVLDRVQFESLRGMDLIQSVKVVHQSKELPFSPVVWFGQTDARQKGLAGVFQNMKRDPEGQVLLKQLQTDGFGPVDANIDSLTVDGVHGPCKP